MRAQTRKPFEAFEKLPAEVRVQIWNYLIPAPRVVNLVPIKGQKPVRMPLPIILTICKESRHEAFRAGIIMIAPRKKKEEPMLWFNARTDMMIISIKNGGMIRMPGKKPGVWGWRRLGHAVEHIRHVAVDSLGIFAGTEEQNLSMWKAKLPNLETVTYSKDWGVKMGVKICISEWPLELRRTPKGAYELTVTLNRRPQTWALVQEHRVQAKVAARVFKCKERKESWEELK